MRGSDQSFFIKEALCIPFKNEPHTLQWAKTKIERSQYLRDSFFSFNNWQSDAAGGPNRQLFVSAFRASMNKMMNAVGRWPSKKLNNQVAKKTLECHFGCDKNWAFVPTVQMCRNVMSRSFFTHCWHSMNHFLVLSSWSLSQSYLLGNTLLQQLLKTDSRSPNYSVWTRSRPKVC